MPDWINSLPISPLYQIHSFTSSTISYGILLLTVFLFSAFALSRLTHEEPWRNFFPLGKVAFHQILAGFGITAGVMTAVFLIETSLGWIAVDAWVWQKQAWYILLPTAWVGLLANLVTAVSIETVFCGFLLSALVRVTGQKQALAILVAVFCLSLLPIVTGHRPALPNLVDPLLSRLLIVMIGGICGWIYLQTRNLWLPVAVHFTWSFIEADLFNLSAGTSNPDLIGAVTILNFPLAVNGYPTGIGVVLEALMIATIAVLVWVWLHCQPDQIFSRQD